MLKCQPWQEKSLKAVLDFKKLRRSYGIWLPYKNDIGTSSQRFTRTCVKPGMATRKT